ncbi:hypothetical protein HK105_204014 [Polyrhizophydium stewartii]|uniref:Uncharacterized protein n=1 Tax=Polyrhizophydium stewartii TaxID=2732419 RepID=A0ABR4NAP5_9FUNG
MDRSPPAVLLAAATAAAAAAALGLNALALAVLARSRLARSRQTVLYSHLAAAAAATAALALAQLLRPAVPALRLPTPADVARPPPAPSDHNPLAPRDTPSACAELAAAAHLALSLATCSLVAIALHHRTINEFAALAAAFKRRAAAAAHTPHSPVPVPAPEYNPEHHPHGRLQPTPGHSTTVTIPASAAALTPASSSPSSTPSPSRMLLSPQTPSPLAGRGPAYHPSVNHWVAAVWAAAIAKTSLSTAVQTTTVHTVGAPVCALGAVGRTNVAQFLHTLDIFSSLSMAACIVWWYSVTAVAPRADPPSSVSLAVSPGGALGPLPRPHAAVGSAGASSGIRGSMESLAARAAGAGSPSGSLSDGQSLHVRSPSSQTGHGDPWQYANHRAACDTEIDYDHLQAQIANAQSARSAFAISLPGVLLLIVHAVETAFEIAAPAGQGPRKRGSPAATIQLAP